MFEIHLVTYAIGAEVDPLAADNDFGISGGALGDIDGDGYPDLRSVPLPSPGPRRTAVRVPEILT